MKWKICSRSKVKSNMQDLFITVIIFKCTHIQCSILESKLYHLFVKLPPFKELFDLVFKRQLPYRNHYRGILQYQDINSPYNIFTLRRSSDNRALPSISAFPQLPHPYQVSSYVLCSFRVTPFSNMFCSSHLEFDVPLAHFPFDFMFNTFLRIISLFILEMCTYHLTLLFLNLPSIVFLYNSVFISHCFPFGSSSHTP